MTVIATSGAPPSANSTIPTPQGCWARAVGFLAILARLVWAAGVPLIAWLFGVLFLALPTQTSDLLADATDGQIVAYHVTVAFWSITCWFWARWCLNLQPVSEPEQLRTGISPQPFLVTGTADLAEPAHSLRSWLPRIPLLASPLVAMIPLLRTGEGADLVLNAGLFALFQWPLVILVALRDSAAASEWWLIKVLTHDKRHDPKQAHCTPSGQAPNTIHGGIVPLAVCLERLPFGRSSCLFWVLGFAAFAVALWLTDQVVIPATLGAPASALIGLSFATGVITLMSVLIRRLVGIPGLPLVVVLAVAIASVSHNHHVRMIDPGGKSAAVILDHTDPAIAQRPVLRTALDGWLTLCGRDPDQPRIVLVATAGGASRAALWTASVLHQVEQVVGVQEFRRSLFAVSGVSGGSLGAAAYAASLPPDGCASADPASEERWRRLRRALSTNFLAPPVAAYLSTDLLARFVPIFGAPDRAAALERSWEAALRDSWRQKSGSPSPPRAGGLEDPFTSIGGASDRRRPLLLLNGTHADTGLPILTAPVQVKQDQFPLALDLLDLLGRDVRASTAVSNSARFPVVTPGGTLTNSHPPPCPPDNPECRRTTAYGGYVMDGGYVENFGAETIRDLVADLDTWRDSKRKLAGTFTPHVLVIQVSSDPSASVEELPRCGSPPAAQLPLRGIDRPSQALSDVFGPLVTVVDARGARGARTAGDLMRAKCPPPASQASGSEAPRSHGAPGSDATTNGPLVEYVHFGLCDVPVGEAGRNANEVVGLNWALTETAAAYLAEGPDFSKPPERDAARPSGGSGAPGSGPSKVPANAMSACGNSEQMARLINWFRHKW